MSLSHNTKVSNTSLPSRETCSPSTSQARSQEHVGWRLQVQELLVQKQIDKRELARRSGLHVQTIKRFCNNPRYDAKLSTLTKLASALGVKVTDLIADLEEEI